MSFSQANLADIFILVSELHACGGCANSNESFCLRKPKEEVGRTKVKRFSSRGYFDCKVARLPLLDTLRIL